MAESVGAAVERGVGPALDSGVGLMRAARRAGLDDERSDTRDGGRPEHFHPFTPRGWDWGGGGNRGSVGGVLLGQDGSTPLHVAFHNGHLEAVQALVDRGADVRARNNVRRPACRALTRRRNARTPTARAALCWSCAGGFALAGRAWSRRARPQTKRLAAGHASARVRATPPAWLSARRNSTGRSLRRSRSRQQSSWPGRRF